MDSVHAWSPVLVSSIALTPRSMSREICARNTSILGKVYHGCASETIVLSLSMTSMSSSMRGSYSGSFSLSEIDFVCFHPLLNPSLMRLFALIHGAICSSCLRFFLYLRTSSTRCALLYQSSCVLGKHARIASNPNGTIRLSGNSIMQPLALSCSHCLWIFSAFPRRMPVSTSSSSHRSESA